MHNDGTSQPPHHTSLQLSLHNIAHPAEHRGDHSGLMIMYNVLVCICCSKMFHIWGGEMDDVHPCMICWAAPSAAQGHGQGSRL